jgi:hypothetical protein
MGLAMQRADLKADNLAEWPRLWGHLRDSCRRCADRSVPLTMCFSKRPRTPATPSLDVIWQSYYPTRAKTAAVKRLLLDCKDWSAIFQEDWWARDLAYSSGMLWRRGGDEPACNGRQSPRSWIGLYITVSTQHEPLEMEWPKVSDIRIPEHIHFPVLPGGGKSSRLYFPKTTATLGRLTAKFFTHSACFLTFHGHFKTACFS